mmetsp:Transcript_908/g.2059  ORF Transcript_908/g.2059 Transcript_908/m.2059 type:complete len:216 (-) Transcript_908:352-999(-)
MCWRIFSGKLTSFRSCHLVHSVTETKRVHKYKLNPKHVLCFNTKHNSVIHKIHTLLNLFLQIWQHLIKPRLFVIRQFTQRQDLLHSILAEFDRRREEFGIGQIGFDVGALYDVLAAHCFEGIFREYVSGVGHGEGGGSRSGLCGDYLVSSELCPNSNSLQLLIRKRRSLHSRKQWQNRNTGMSTNDCHIDILGILSKAIGHEGIGATDVEGSDAH